MQVQSLRMGVRAALDDDREMLYWALLYDPLTAAVLSMAEIRQMADEMYEAERQWLPQFED